MKIILTYGLIFLASFSFSQSFEIYVSDAGNFNNPPWQILKFDENGLNPSVFIHDSLNWPQDILFLDEELTVLISNLGSGLITRHDISTGAYIDNFATGISGPTRIKIGPDSLLYVLQWTGNGKVLRYQLDGTFLGEFTSIGVPQSIGINWDDKGNLYVSSYKNDLVRKFDAAGTDLGVFIDSNLAGPTNIWFDDNGDLLVSDYDGTAVRRFDTSGNYTGDFLTGLSKSEGVGFFPNGDILIGNGASSSVKLFDSNGNYLKDIIASGTANLINPNAIVIRKTTNVAIEDLDLSTSAIIYPNIGDTFYIDRRLAGKIKSWKVYSMAGKLTENRKTTEALAWKATIVREGVYIMLLEFHDGSTYTRKIIVRK